MKNESANKFINAINEAAGYEYIKDRQSEIAQMVTTNDSIEDFMGCQSHIETRKTDIGIIEVFEVAGSHEIQVMDFGSYRLVLND